MAVGAVDSTPIKPHALVAVAAGEDTEETGPPTTSAALTGTATGSLVRRLWLLTLV